MTEVLDNMSNVLVEGRTFSDILPDIQKIVYYYVRLHFNKWGKTLESNGYTIEDVAQQMFVNLFNRKSLNDLSNIQKKFVEASEKGLGMKYIRNSIGLAVFYNIISLARTFKNKPKTVSFEDYVSVCCPDTSDSSKVIEMLDLLEDKSQNIANKVSYDFILSSIENTFYRDYYIKRNNTYKMLSVHDVINMITLGLTISDMASKVYIRKDNVNITYKRMNEIVKEVRQKAIKSYHEGNCLIDLDFLEDLK